MFQSLVQKHFPSEKQRREKGSASKRKRRSFLCLEQHTLICISYFQKMSISNDNYLWPHFILQYNSSEIIWFRLEASYLDMYKCCTVSVCDVGKPKGRQAKCSKQGADAKSLINISDDSSTESDGVDSDSNSSPDSLQDNNDDVIFITQTNCHAGTVSLHSDLSPVVHPIPLFLDSFSHYFIQLSVWCEYRLITRTERFKLTKAPFVIAIFLLRNVIIV